MSRRAGQSHESLARDDEEIQPSSDRAFGFVFAAVFGLVGLLPLWRGASPRWWSLAVAGAFLTVALVIPRLLAPLNRVWLMVGLLLHMVVNPLVMALLFFTTVTPIALIMRALGQDPLRLRLDPDAPTYWIERRPPGPSANSMPRQF
jgi:hypothetical protein